MGGVRLVGAIRGEDAAEEFLKGREVFLRALRSVSLRNF